MKTRDEMTAVELLDKLAGDTDVNLWYLLESGSEKFWGVSEDRPGSLGNLLSRIAGRADGEQMDLRGFANDVERLLWDGGGEHRLAETYDRLEEELSELDALRSVGSEADRLVRDHGGLDAVRERLERVETWDADKAALFELCAECGGVDGVRARMMPAGVEWPRYDTGDQVMIGDEFMGKDGKTYTAKQVQFIGKCFSLYDFCDRKPQFSGFYGERVKRPAVLAADGEPLEVGQTVYTLKDDRPYTVKFIDGDHVYINAGGAAMDVWRFPDKLTHTKPEPPDSWKRIEEDKGLNPFDYCKKVGHKLWTFDNAEEFKASDLVRRCKALSERDAS